MTQNTSSRVIASEMDAIINKEAGFFTTIKENHQRSCLAADRLMRDGILEQALKRLAQEEDPVVSEEEVLAFLKEQRARLLDLAARNVENAYQVGCFIDAAKDIRQQELSNTQTQTQGDQLYRDYEPVFRDAIEKNRAAKASSKLPLQQEKFYREIAERLGEPLNTQDGKKRNEEEEIMVVNEGVGQSFSLKCPITMVLMEDPVVNKVCKHNYSKAAIQNHISTKRKNRGPNYKVGCPVPGCFNDNVTLSQLEDDTTISIQVRRFQRKEARLQLERSSQAEDIDPSDDEN